MKFCTLIKYARRLRTHDFFSLPLDIFSILCLIIFLSRTLRNSNNSAKMEKEPNIDDIIYALRISDFVAENIVRVYKFEV